MTEQNSTGWEVSRPKEPGRHRRGCDIRTEGARIGCRSEKDVGSGVARMEQQKVGRREGARVVYQILSGCRGSVPDAVRTQGMQGSMSGTSPDEGC